MRTIIAGSRFPPGITNTWTDEHGEQHEEDVQTQISYNAELVLNTAMSKYLDWTPTEIVSGHAEGVDLLGEAWARANNLPIKIFVPDYEKYSKWRAPKKRNKEMAEYAGALVALWDGQSKGTRHMITTASRKGLLVKVFKLI
jgi:hypothetical protein